MRFSPEEYQAYLRFLSALRDLEAVLEARLEPPFRHVRPWPAPERGEPPGRY